MKKFTKEFINKQRKEEEPTNRKVKGNAKRAMKVLGIPEKLYLELYDEFLLSPLIDWVQNTNTAFFAGFLVGWAEKNSKIK
jgi:hypothetical protein